MKAMKTIKELTVIEFSILVLLAGVVYAILQTKRTEVVTNEAPIVQVCVTNSLPQVEIGMPSLTCSVTNVLSDVALADGMRRAEIEKAEEEKLHERARKAIAALFYINHLSMSVTKIKTYNNPAVMEEEYAALSLNSLNLNAINDEEVIDIIHEIMDYITEMRIQERERAMLKDELDQGMSDALFDSLSGISMTGNSPIGAVFSLITSAANAAINYKRARARVMKEFKKQEWGLDKAKIYELNELNKKLLRSYWVLVKRYDIPDKFRVTETDISRFFERMKDETPEMRYRFLSSNEKTYQYLPTYWYYRGQTAYECGNSSDAERSLEEFGKIQKEFGQILRIDPLAAKCALLRTQLMLEKEDKTGVKADASVLREQLEIITDNTTVDEWTLRYFCATVYAANLHDFKAADDALSPVIDEMESKRKSNLVNWCDLMEVKKTYQGTNEVDRLAPSGDALYECKTLVVRLGEGTMDTMSRQERLRKICESSNASAREKLFCYGSMNFEQALDALAPDLSRMFLYKDGDALCLALPMSWALSREGEMAFHVPYANFEFDHPDLRLFKSYGPGKDRDIIGDPDENKYVVVRFNGVSQGNYGGVLTMRYDHGGQKRSKGEQVGSKGTSLQVALEFPLGQGGRTYPSRAALGKWVKYSADALEDDQPHWESVKVIELNSKEE